MDKPELIKGKRVLVVEDGPTLTHGEMKFGAGTIAAQDFGAKELVDPRPLLLIQLRKHLKSILKLASLLPAMGYGDDK